MGGVVDAIVDVVTDIIDAVVDIVKAAWQELVVPVLENVFKIFGIEDETVVTVNKVSIAVLSDEPENITKNAFTKVIMNMSKNEGGFYRNYVEHFNRHKGEMANYYRYAANGPYVYGLPEMRIQGNSLDFNAVSTSINADLGGSFTVLSVDTSYPQPEIWFKNFLQEAPYNYIPYLNTLTKEAANGESYSDWEFDSVQFNNTTMEYDITVKREAELTQAWLTISEVYANETESVTLTVNLNRAVPTGKTLTANITYTGASGSDFTGNTSVDLTAGNTTATITITCGAVTSVKRLDIELSFVDTSAFESLSIVEARRITSTVLVPSGVVALCIGQIPVQENSTASIPVKLSGALSSFSVDWSTEEDTALSGTDFTETSGSLSFTGTAGETKFVTVNTLADGLNESFETFNIELSNPSDSVDVSQKGVVRITDTAIDAGSAVNGFISEIINQPNYSLERYLITTYHESSAPSNEWFYWLYRLEDETYPDIDPNASSISNLDMMPVGILRKNKQFINQERDISQDLFEDFGEDTAVYKTTRNLLSKINLQVKDVIESIADNPDIDLIDDAYVNFAMNPADTNKVLSKLLWLHFYEIIVVHGITSNTEEYSATFEEQDVNNALAWTKNEHIQNINVMNNATYLPFRTKHLAAKINEYYHSVENEHMWLFYKTGNDTADLLKVENLAGMNAIAYDGFHNIAFNKVGEDGFTIPVSYYLINKLKGPEVIEVFPYLFRVDIFSIEITELAWYQTDAFKTFFQVTMIVLTILTAGTTSWWMILGQLLFNYAVVQIVVYIAELTGNAELAAIVGIIATVVIGGNFGISFDYSSIEGLTNIVTTFSMNLGAAQQGELNALSEDLADLLDQFEQQQEMIKNEDTSTGALTGSEYLDIMSSDSLFYVAGPIQFNFDLLFDYDNLVGNYFEQKLIVGPQ